MVNLFDDEAILAILIIIILVKLPQLFDAKILIDTYFVNILGTKFYLSWLLLYLVIFHSWGVYFLYL